MMHVQRVSIQKFLVTTSAAELLSIMTSSFTLVVVMLHFQRVALREFFVKTRAAELS